MILLLRALPFLVGLFEALLFTLQRQYPDVYPWIILPGIVFVPVASFVISWKRLAWRDLLEKMVPSYLLIASLAFGLLLIETQFLCIVFTVLAALASFLSLELLFVLAYDPSSYPVNGLSRLNIAYVPFVAWSTASTLAGLLVFLHVHPLWYVGVMTLLGLILFRTTGHPGATPMEHRVWMLMGAIIGANIGWIGTRLPLTMPMHGFLAAVVFAAILRMRRYLYAPKPSRRLAWIEGSLTCLLLCIGLLTTTWI